MKGFTARDFMDVVNREDPSFAGVIEAIDIGIGVNDPDIFRDYRESDVAGSSLYEFMVALFAEPNALTEIARDSIKADAVSNPGRTTLIRQVEELSKAVDQVSRDIAKHKMWNMTSGESIAVMEVWLDKNDNLIGSPAERKVLKKELNKILICRMVTIENGPSIDKMFLSVSNGVYRTDSTTKEAYRQDYMIDVVRVLNAICKGNDIGHSSRVGVFMEFMDDLYPLLKAVVNVATTLAVENCLPNYKAKLYGVMEVSARRKIEVTPERNPNALIDIGSWS